MKAGAFLIEFHSAVEDIWPTGTGKAWTQGIYAVLQRVGSRNDYIMRCKGCPDGGELYNLDFIFIPSREGVPAAKNWATPAVVIEHENMYKFYDTAVDFWKLCHFAAPLRVMIGYQKSEDEAAKVGRQLIALYDNWNWRQPEDAETLLLMGWYQNSRPRQWLIWKRDGSATAWEHSRTSFISG